jgi:hypothetical protein
MIVKYVSKFVLEILPSVVATIIGAYIVNHYIVTKPAADAPVAASVSTAEPKAAESKTADLRRTDAAAVKSDVRGGETPSEPDVANVPEPAAAKKGAPDKALVEKSTDKPAEIASLPVETRRHQPAPRDRTVAKTVPAPMQTPTPGLAAATIAPPVEASPAQEEHRDANDLARAAIERLRGSSEASRAADVPRGQDLPRQDLPRVVSAPVQPLPPPIMVSTPTGEALNPNAAASLKSYNAPVSRVDDPRRPTPPADIPSASQQQPMDLHAEATGSIPERTTVADDVLSAAKSVFHAVLPR